MPEGDGRAVKQGAVLYDTRGNTSLEPVSDRGLCHVVSVFEEVGTGDRLFNVWDGTHTYQEFVHEDRLLEDFELAGWTFPRGKKPLYHLTRNCGVEDPADLMTDGGRGSPQARLDVGDTRPPRAQEAEYPSIGGVVSMVMCAHRYDPDDLSGWHTHEPDAVVRGWVQENAEAVAADTVGLTHSTREDTEMPPAKAPTEEHHAWAGDDADDTTEQTTLVTDGGEVEQAAKLVCDLCDCTDDDVQRRPHSTAEIGRPGNPALCPDCNRVVSR